MKHPFGARDVFFFTFYLYIRRFIAHVSTEATTAQRFSSQRYGRRVDRKHFRRVFHSRFRFATAVSGENQDKNLAVRSGTENIWLVLRGLEVTIY